MKDVAYKNIIEKIWEKRRIQGHTPEVVNNPKNWSLKSR